MGKPFSLDAFQILLPYWHLTVQKEIGCHFFLKTWDSFLKILVMSFSWYKEVKNNLPFLIFNCYFFYCCSSTVVSIFPPPLSPTPPTTTSHPQPSPLWLCPWVLYTSHGILDDPRFLCYFKCNFRKLNLGTNKTSRSIFFDSNQRLNTLTYS